MLNTFHLGGYLMKLDVEKKSTKSNWDNACFLSERIPTDTIKKELNLNERVKQWRKETALENNELFYERLKLDNLSPEQFNAIVSNEDWSVESSSILWTKKLKMMEDVFDSTNSNETIPITIKSVPFHQGTIPFILWAKKELISYKENLEDEYSKFLDSQIIENILLNLCLRLVQLSMQTFTLEMHVANLEGKLVGNTAEDRFKHFGDEILKNKTTLFSILNEYPVLARLLVECTNNYIEFIKTTLTRLFTDKKELEFYFQMEINHLTSITMGLSDLHRRGQSVIIFTFDNNKKIVYKPKSLSISKHFQDLLEWINEKGIELKFKIQKILDKQEYGWEEYIEYTECVSEDEVKHFYKRQGGYLALLYLLEATDFHFENVIASGEHPFLIDLESLFTHQTIPDSVNETTAMSKAMKEFRNSVFRTQLIPFFIGGTEVSGLGGMEGQETPFDVLQWKDVGKVSMKATREKGKISGGNNIPKINGKLVNVQDYKKELIEGFVTTYNIMKENKFELKKFLNIFENDTIRKVIRPTYVYSLLLEGSYHPDYYRNGLDRDRLLDRLWCGVEYVPHLKGVIASEKKDMLLNDIPFFYTKTNSRHLWNSFDEIIPNFFYNDSLSVVKKRCEQLSDEDCIKQCDYIQISLQISSNSHMYRKENISKENENTNFSYEKEELLKAAIQIGDLLEKKAFHGEDENDVTWLGLQWKGKASQWNFSSLESNLYSGLSGVSLFLGYLGEITSELKYKQLSYSAIMSAVNMYRHKTDSDKSISAFQGDMSIVYTLIHLSELQDNYEMKEELKKEAFFIAKDLIPLIENDKNYDILDGVAGALIVYLELYLAFGDKTFYEAAIKCGKHLINNSMDLDNKAGWLNPLIRKPIGGFSHGASGIAWALLKLYNVSGIETFKQKALNALNFERAQYKPEERNWYDLRTNTMSFPSWCNGAAGIALSNKLNLDVLKNSEELILDLNAAIQTTIEKGFGNEYCLCHGDLGNLSILRSISNLADENINKLTQNVIGRFLYEKVIEKDTARLTSFMMGLTGAGYVLLSLLKPLPSPLFLEFPKKN